MSPKWVAGLKLLYNNFFPLITQQYHAAELLKASNPAFIIYTSLPNRGQFLKERICSSWTKFFSLREDPFLEVSSQEVIKASSHHIKIKRTLVLEPQLMFVTALKKAKPMSLTFPCLKLSLPASKMEPITAAPREIKPMTFYTITKCL